MLHFVDTDMLEACNMNTDIFLNEHADDLIVDPRNFEWLRESNCPVVSIGTLLSFITAQSTTL